MATGRKSVLSNLLGLHEELERVIEDVMGVRSRGGRRTSWGPRADVFTIKDTLVVRFEIAGVPREAIDLSYRDGELTVHGTRLESADEPKQGYWQMEISHGPFERSVKIPPNVDGERITAVCRDGILEVRMPILPEKTKAKDVRIKTNA